MNAAVIILAVLLLLGWAARGTLCQRCHWRLIDLWYRGEYLCQHCLARQLDAHATKEDRS